MLCYNAISDQFEYGSSGSSECTLIDLLQRVFPVFSSCIRLMCDEYEHVTITSVQFPFSAYFLDGIIRKWTMSYCQRGGYVMLFSAVLATFSPCKCFRCGPHYQLWLSTGWTNFDSAYTDANILRSTAVPCKQYASFLRPDAGAAAGPSNPHWQLANRLRRTGHCAFVPWHRHTLRRTQAPHGPFEIFGRVRYGEKFYYRCGPLPTPLVVMITKLLSVLSWPSALSVII